MKNSIHPAATRLAAVRPARAWALCSAALLAACQAQPPLAAAPQARASAGAIAGSSAGAIAGTGAGAAANAPANAQAGAPSGGWDRAYGGADKSYDQRLLAVRGQIAAKFKVLEYTDPATGTRLAYNLFVPEKLEAGRKYPLVMFIADASTAGKGALAPLMQGWGGIVWAMPESQAQNPAFVLVPAYGQTAVNDQWQTTPEVAATPALVRHVMASHPVDGSRVYATGQSMGGMIAFHLNSVQPQLFAASMFVGSQWDVRVLQPLARARFIYAISAADPKASVGMREVGALLAENGVPHAEVEFSARLPQPEQDSRVAAMLAEGRAANFIRFSPGTVVPEGSTHKGAEHMYSFDYAYLLNPARQWLFAQKK